MGAGDLIYKTGDGSLAYKSGDGRLAYKAAAAAAHGNIVNWTASSGQFWYAGYYVFVCPVVLNYLYGTSPWYWRRNDNVHPHVPVPEAVYLPNPPRIWAWWEGNYWWLRWTGFYNEELVLYNKADSDVPTYPEYPLVGTYTRVGTFNLGTVTVSA